MDVLTNNYKFGNHDLDQNSGEAYARMGIFDKLIGFITLTKEDRLKAGIYVGYEGREWLDRSALVLSLPDSLENLVEKEHAWM